ncbi:MAG: HIT domain-containing protein [Nitrosopumilus sp.]|uniref:HIT domain-containing protein n=1 Tax=Nitrosopumilus sp. b3 TaxID=2109909 RepID=UPI0015F36679|nr:HIT family protein [Nitrosopumilus sp. b3]KAF6247527.1 HIT family protein [Nitrosopumilus sp. b3]MBT8251852.1 HIT domain-containing protein [Nitrosopumilus sp.]NNL53027.1 HIT family protein [Nitrosopumilus sp.]
MGCIFCEILDGKRDGHLLYEDKSHISFLDKYPIDVGHSLIIPREHHERITDMDSEDVGKIFSLVPKIASAILKATGADAFSLGQNNGRAAKQIIPHVHIHIIPRYNSKGTIWTKRQISTEDELVELSKNIRSFIV